MQPLSFAFLHLSSLPPPPTSFHPPSPSPSEHSTLCHTLVLWWQDALALPPPPCLPSLRSFSHRRLPTSPPRPPSRTPPPKKGTPQAPPEYSDSTQLPSTPPSHPTVPPNAVVEHDICSGKEATNEKNRTNHAFFRLMHNCTFLCKLPDSASHTTTTTGPEYL